MNNFAAHVSYTNAQLLKPKLVVMVSSFNYKIQKHNFQDTASF